MRLLNRLLSPSPSSDASPKSGRSQFVVPSASFDPVTLKAKVQVLTPEQVACIAYFPASDTDIPRLGMNMDVRFIRPGRPGSAIDFPLLPSPSQLHAPVSNHTHSSSLPSFPGTAPSSTQIVLAPLRELNGPAIDSRARVALRKLRARTKRLGLGLKPRPALDPEQIFQDEQHKTHMCWRCRKAGARQKNCRAFRRPGHSLAAEMYA